MENLIKIIDAYGVTIKEERRIVDLIIYNEKSTPQEKESAFAKDRELTEKITEVVKGIDFLSRYKSLIPAIQNENWDRLQEIIEKRPRNSMGTAIAYLMEQYYLIKK